MIKKLSPTYVVLCLYFLLNGIEYAVIIPSLNGYLKTLNASSFAIGMALSAFCLTGLISAPIYGRVTDVTGSTKGAILISNLFEIGGNFMYFSASNSKMVICSRLIAGLGSGSGSSVMGMISRNTLKEERTAVFSQFMMLRQMGLIIGPAFNLFLRKLNFYIGYFHVNKYTAPGIFMSLLWFIHEVLMVWFYQEYISVGQATGHAVQQNESADLPQSSAQSSISTTKSTNFFHYVYNDLLREEVIVCLTMTFFTMFIQTGVETLLTPLTAQLFDWGELNNSIYFCVAGLVIVTSSVTLATLSKKIHDRQLMLSGIITMVVLYVVFLLFLFFGLEEPQGTTWVLAVFCLYSIFLVFDLPFVWVPQSSLFSKVTSEKTQAFNQGIRLLVLRLGQILGPLWAASMLNKLTILAAVNLVLVTLLMIMVIASYNRLKVPDEISVQGQATLPTEETPLLSNDHVDLKFNI